MHSQNDKYVIYAEVAQLVELQPSKLVVASSSLVFRSIFDDFFIVIAEVAQLVELQPSKLVVASSSLVFRSSKTVSNNGFFLFYQFRIARNKKSYLKLF